MTNKENLLFFIESKKDLLFHVSDSIWDYAETRFEEYKSSELLCTVLRDSGFTITKGIADMETAFVASYGSGKPVIGFLGEFDALYGMSQKAGIAEKELIIEGGKGHGCGHHALGAGALTAALAVKDYLEKNNIQGTVRFFGCPGEEGGSGKAYIARGGYFEDVDAAFTWHPGSTNFVNTFNFLANISAYFKFKGKSAHAAAAPHLGRSALDAVELMNVGVNFLREHIVPEARVHYAITDTGGLSPNVVQANASVLYLVRAPELSQAREIFERVSNIARGAAQMTDTELEIVFDRASSNFVLNRTLEELLHDKFIELGPVPVDDKDIEFARRIRETLGRNEKGNSEKMLTQFFGEFGDELSKQVADKEIIDIVYPFKHIGMVVPASSDVGDASWNMPLAQISTSCFAKDTAEHSWQLVAQGKSDLCHKAMLHAGEVMALAGIELLENPQLLAKAKEEFKTKLGNEKYICPIPPEVKPSPAR